MILGIDFGISTTDVALVRGCKPIKTFHLETRSQAALKKALRKNKIDLEKVEHIVVTGANRSLKKVLGKKFSRVGEIDAIGFGGVTIANSKSALVVSMGTGTCMVSVKQGKAKHVGGTGLAGGTVLGLSKKLVGTSSIQKLSRLALKGKKSKTDLSVREAIGSGIGIVPSDATASNFAKVGGSKNDLALGIQAMVGETNAVIAALAAKQARHKKIVFVGKAHAFPAVKRALKRVLAYYGFKPSFPKHRAYATAIGAAVFWGNCFK